MNPVPPRYASRIPVVAILAAGVTFCVLSHRPLWHTDLWGHLAYGRLIWHEGRLPEVEPLLVLSEQTPYVDPAWLSQLILYGTHSAASAPGLQCLFAAVATGCLCIFFAACYRRTNNVWLSLTTCGLFVWVEWQQLKIIRPQLAGQAAFVLLLAVVTRRRWDRWVWWFVPILFAVWANLHGSFPVGLALLGGLGTGRAIDVLRRTGRLSAAVKDKRFRRFVLLTILSAAAALCNPYGWRLYSEVLSVSSNPNVSSLIEWQPLRWWMRQTHAAAAAAVLYVLLACLSRRRISAAELLLLGVLGGMMLWKSRFIVWWAPLVAYYLALNGNSVWKRFTRRRSSPEMSPRRRWQTVVAGTTVLAAVLCSPLVLSWQSNGPRDESSGISAATPVEAVNYLRRHPPPGLVFSAFEWGDYLLWAGPPDVEVFAASHVHVLPPNVWRDYVGVLRTQKHWPQTLEKYGVTTLLLDRRRQRRLIERVAASSRWELDYRDDRAVVYTMRR